MSTFLRDPSFYKQSINPISQYVTQNAHYLNKMTGYDRDYCRNYIVDGIKSKKFIGIQDPTVEYFERGDNGDRYETSISLSRYIQTAVNEDLILTPTFTAYVKPYVKRSLLAEFSVDNARIRSIAKKEAQKAKAAGDIELAIIKNNEQDNRKRYNNSLSGTFVAGGSVVNNPTAHSTLTSITRTVSSLGNASNEKIIAGNRHYRNSDVTLANLISITSLMDREEFTNTMETFGLVYPSVEQTMDCIHYSSDLYWVDPRAFKKIEDFLRKLDPIELAAIVYTGDFYHLRKLNEEFVRTFITKLAKKVKGVVVPDAMNVAKTTDELVMNYVHQICITEVRGIGKDYTKLNDEAMNIVAATALNVQSVVKEYQELINGIFLTRSVPSSTAYIPDMIRRSVVLSDTDSTMFAIDEWVLWYFGNLRFDDEGFAMSGAVMYIATQCIAHTLAIFSANMNVEQKNMFVLAMKPEFLFPVFAQSSVAKHYFTIQYVKEGNVHLEPEMEIKGVHLKNSAAPREIIKNAADKMKDILLKVMNNEKISINDELMDVVNLEMKILNSLFEGKVDYLKGNKIKAAEAYASDAMRSPYQHHDLWMKVFYPKYKVMEHPTYAVFKIPTILRNKTAIARWLNEIEDRELAARMGAWIQEYKKNALGTMYVSAAYARSYGIPKEIIAVMDVKRIVLDLTNANRMILSTLGYNSKVDWMLKDQLTLPGN